MEGDTVDNITKQYGLHKVSKEATHILDNTSSCIDLMFTSQRNLITKSGVQIVYAKLNLQIYFPPPYLREVWYYKDANTELIKRAFCEFNWQRAFLNTTVDGKVVIFTKTVFNNISSFIPHEIYLCNDKKPPWFNKKMIRTLIKEKNMAFNRYRNNSSNLELKRHLKFLQENLNASIESSKQSITSEKQIN